MRTRLIVAFIVVALLSALVSAWFANLTRPLLSPSRLAGWSPGLPGRHLPTRPAHPAGAPSPLSPSAWLPAPRCCWRRSRAWRMPLPAGFCGRCGGWRRRRSGCLAGICRSGSRPRAGMSSPGWSPLSTTMAAALEDKVGELQRMEARARQFAGDVSHELRTPLTAMTAVADMLGEHPGLDGDTAAAARLVRQEIFHLGRLVEDLIEISRFDAGTAQLVIDDTDVAAAVSGCLRARGWTDVCADVPAGLTVRLDRRRFDVIVANLVGNALRHGGPPVTVTASSTAAGPGRRVAGPGGARPRARAPGGRHPARVRPVLQGRHRTRPFRGQRPGPGDRLGERAPARRAHRSGQPPRRRSGVHRQPAPERRLPVSGTVPAAEPASCGTCWPLRSSGPGPRATVTRS